ncbi:DUF4126 domain-containing protein [Microterricola pindariensis]|uniref:DUF4126 domain-containing protein n=1 Tax=Microterricola pindariensis TaxID=478010 RepID=A0ABX5B1P9_9MICO|nr:DUF4126 domain-containing protein [Microterricola pindariensis]PPL20543.1 hypothetical protein GY24_00465 [Microterricola pindariensis]
MLELLTGTALAASAGLNAYVPLLLIGLGARFTGLVELPANWAWLQNEWVLGILAVLLVVEVLADKVPGLDSVNDMLQTVIRPTSGGLAFGSGTTATTVAITDPAAFFSSNQWVPIALGAVIALGVHLVKLSVRPIANALTAGAAAPVLSAAEDVSSVVLSVLAILAPLLALLAMAGGVLLLFRWLSRLRRSRRARPQPASIR